MSMRTDAALELDLVGRDRELRALDDLLTDVRGGRAQVVVLRGDGGAGKSALLDRLGARAHGCTVLRVTGAESEAGLDYAGLHQLVAPLSGMIDRLPAPQRSALRSAFGLQDDGREPDPFLVALAVLGVVKEASAQRPLVCLIDDAHRLDPVSCDVFAFVGRRLAADAVLVAFAAPPLPGSEALSGFHELTVAGLDDRAARTLLRSVVPGPLDEAVLRRIVSEAGGNPLVLLEESRGLSGDRLAGGFATPAPGVQPDGFAASLRGRFARLPRSTQRLLLTVAAEPRQDPLTIWRAALAQGLGPADGVAAEAEGLADLGEVRFAHPLVRSTVYRAASDSERRAAHRALADATDPDLDPDRHAWHLAHATSGCDEGVALALERSAGRARARGGLAAAAAIRELAVGLTPDAGHRAERALRAADDMLRSGAPGRARQLTSVAEAVDAGPRRAAEIYRLRAQVAAACGNQEAESLVVAARRLEAFDPGRADVLFRDAFSAALATARSARRDGVVDVAEAILAARRTPSPAERPTAELLGALAGLVTDGHRAGAPHLREALTAVVDAELPAEEAAGWLSLAAHGAGAVLDETTWRALSTRAVEASRGSGWLRVLLDALGSRVALELLSGDLSTATSLARERATVAAASRKRPRSSGPADLVVAAWQGDERRFQALATEGATDAAAGGDGSWPTVHAWSSALLRNALGEHGEALVAAEDGFALPEGLAVATWSALELVEAAARAGLPDRGRRAARHVADAAGAHATDWALGTAALCSALLGDGPEAEAGYREAVDRLGRTRLRFVLARAHLLYGEWLHGAGRAADARDHLGTAHDMLADMGADGFADRAGRGLGAVGGHAPRRSSGAPAELTSQEAEIARLTAQGHTNPEIAAQLFLSPRTVEWHLRKIFAKLGVGSRKEIRDAIRWTLTDRPGGPAHATATGRRTGDKLALLAPGGAS
ncbi:AAA family ATPase [Isoptericola sp. NPDC019693]|uniref:helix-turn-helix transcriptional regulator n=1 Tax=Isoptericola sp. NPDC019693 TaxID=3364009 RepID=UPI003793E939